MLLMNRKVYSGCRTSIKVICLCLISLLLFCGVSCSEKDEQAAEKPSSAGKPKLVLKVEMQAGYVSTCSNLLLTAGYDTLCIWDWSHISKEPQKINIDRSWLPLGEADGRFFQPNRRYSLIYPGRVVCASHQKEDTYILVQNIEGDQEFERWSLGRRWDCDQLRNTRNGRFVAVCLEEDYRFVLQDQDGGRNDKGRHRLGVIDCQSDKICWVSTIYQHSISLPNLSSMAVSEDGKHLVAVGTNSGGFIHLADVTQKKVLWEKVPMGAEVPDGDWTVNFNDVCFSPDNKYVYVGGNCGLFCFDVATGKILSQWEVPGRCMSVAVSPDGRLVAGGGGGNGFVYIYHANTGELLRRLQTGQFETSSLSFSPDSALLATSGVMNTDVKIWKMPSVDSESVEVGEPNETKR